jgi:hypothetical protein
MAAVFPYFSARALIGLLPPSNEKAHNGFMALTLS